MLPEDPSCIHAWQRIGDQITTSGHLVAADIAKLAAIGVAHIIDLAAPEHEWALLDEQERLAGLGIAIGLVIGVALARVIEGALFGVIALEPMLFVAITAVLTLVALLATLLPARHAIAVDPAAALRD